MKFHKVFVVIVFAFIVASCASSVGVVKYNTDTLVGTNKKLGKGVSIAILAFPDKRYNSNERLVVKGQINKFWTESMTRKGAVVDIYAEIYDIMNKKTVWSGKIENCKKRGIGGGIFQDTNEMVSLLNEVLSNAISQAWNQKGLYKALQDLNI